MPNAPLLEYRCKRDVDTALMQHAGIELGPHSYDATLYTHLANSALNFITRVRACEVGVAHYPKWRRSLLIHAETRDFHSRRGMGARTIALGRCTPLTIVDQFGIKISGFTPSSEALGRIRTKWRMSDYWCEKTKVCMDS